MPDFAYRLPDFTLLSPAHIYAALGHPGSSPQLWTPGRDQTPGKLPVPFENLTNHK